jgi:ABC-type Na+ efflux pump permease subunit
MNPVIYFRVLEIIKEIVMSSRSVSSILLKPIIFGLISFFVIFFFFPTFSTEYLGVGFTKDSVETSEKVENLKQIVSEKTGTNIDDVVSAANSDALRGLLDGDN